MSRLRPCVGLSNVEAPVGQTPASVPLSPEVVEQLTVWSRRSQVGVAKWVECSFHAFMAQVMKGPPGNTAPACALRCGAERRIFFNWRGDGSTQRCQSTPKPNLDLDAVHCALSQTTALQSQLGWVTELLLELRKRLTTAQLQVYKVITETDQSQCPLSGDIRSTAQGAFSVDK